MSHSREKKLLMHVCCGPCAVLPVQCLKEEGLFDVTGLFYNPNIHPLAEFERRRETAARFFELAGLQLRTTDDFRQSQWEEYETNPALGGKTARCGMCYRVRLEYAAREAAEGEFDAFTTSLLISPYQEHERIRVIGEELAEQYRVSFYYRDFRPEFRKGQALAREFDLYRQKYCGCILSLAER